jgi:hypothetical protein
MLISLIAAGSPLTPLLVPSALPLDPVQTSGDKTVEQRLNALEADRDRLSQELEAAMDALADAEVGPAGSGSSGPVYDEETTQIWKRLAQRTLAPRAANVYTSDGMSFGGYGEFLGQVFRDRDGDNFDALRWVMYFGQRFSDRWIFNSEIEIEHGSTSTSSATTDSGGSVSIEFAYIDHLLTDSTALRGGVVLVPLGFVNERHEPTTFLASARPQTEQRIIPSTWRASAMGGYGQVGGFAWSGYVLNGLNGSEFNATGVRGGRQKANRASIDDIALAARIDYVDTPGVVVGLSAFSGDSGVGIPEDLGTTIFDIHAEWNTGPWFLRALFAQASVDDTEAFNTRTGENVASNMQGWYAEVGYDLLSLTGDFPNQSLDVFVRYEDLNTQESLEGAFTPSGGIDDTFTTVGLNYKPVSQVVLKTDYTVLDEGDDVFRFLIGYAF